MLDDALDPSEVPRVQEDKGVLYLFVRVPHGNGDATSTIPVLLALGPQFLLTVCAERLPLFERFHGGLVPFSTQWRSQLLLKVLGEAIVGYQHAVTSLGKALRAKISNFGDIDDQDILKLVSSESVLNDFLAALVSMQTLLPSLTSGKLLKVYEEDHDLIEDIQLAMGQAVKGARSQLTTTVNFRQAYSVILTNNLNRVMKFLTVMTVVLTVPMVVSGVFGMNVRLPLETHASAFWLVVGGTLAVVLGLLRVLKYKKLL
jgi:magnesium transporter